MSQPPSEPRYPTVHVEVPHDQTDEVSAMLFALGASGVEERDATTLDRTGREGTVTLVAHFEDEDRARIVVEASPHPARVVSIVGDEWKHRWREFFKPTRVGQRLVVRPSWEPVEAGPDDVVLTIDPGQAFGTGTHETTRLVLAELERIVGGGERVLDVGCGSGILSVGALLFGARSAEGVDIDDESMAASRENAAANGVAARFHVAKRPVGTVRGSFGIVLANIESRVLVPLARSIVERVGPGGTLVLSGLLAHEEDELREVYGELGLEHVRTTREKDWIAMVWRRVGKAPTRAKANAAPSATAKPKPKPKTSAKSRSTAKAETVEPKAKAKKPKASATTKSRSTTKASATTKSKASAPTKPSSSARAKPRTTSKASSSAKASTKAKASSSAKPVARGR